MCFGMLSNTNSCSKWWRNNKKYSNCSADIGAKLRNTVQQKISPALMEEGWNLVSFFMEFHLEQGYADTTAP